MTTKKKAMADRRAATIGKPGSGKRRGSPEDKDFSDTAAAIADPGDHARLLMVNAAVLGLGLVTRNARIVRTGVRMMIAQGLALGGRTLFAQGLHAHGKASAEEASTGEGGRTDSDDAGGIATGSSSATIAVAKAVSTATPIPYIPARLAGLAMTGSDTPPKANPVADFLVGAAIGWLAEKLATRLVGSGKTAIDDDDQDQERG